MAGGFAHITLVDTLCMDSKVLNGIPNLTPAMKRALSVYLNFVELGSVSPDYPSLTLFSGNSAGWANVMHYHKTLDFVWKAVRWIYKMDYKQNDALKRIAWIFGYTAHVITDLVIHPVVNLKVGPYKKNKRKHRLCEIHQDVYIFHKVHGKEITRAEYFKDPGISSCSQKGNRKKLFQNVSDLWKICLPSFRKTEFTYNAKLDRPTKYPNPDLWHKNYIKMIDGVAEEGGKLLPLIKQIAEGQGVVYPALKNLDHRYIDSLSTPEGNMTYDEIFQCAQEKVKNAWSELGKALDTGDPGYFTIPNGNLDNGRDESNKMIFWREKA